MATKIETVKPAKTAKEPVSLVMRIHSQLTTGVLKHKLSVDDLDLLAKHVDRLKAIIA